MADKNYSEKQINDLLAMASKKMGTDPDNLRRKLENGKLDDFVKSTNAKGSDQLKQALSNPEMAKKILNTPAAQALIKKLMKDK